jgi:hypothetical protein
VRLTEKQKKLLLELDGLLKAGGQMHSSSWIREPGGM